MTNPRPEICACLFAHEMLRRLGIVAADIFIDLRMAGYFGVTVKTDGKEWVWTLDRLPASVAPQAFIAEWEAAVFWWNNADVEELDALGMDISPQMAQAVEVIHSLVAKGIPLDPLADVRAQDVRRKAAN